VAKPGLRQSNFNNDKAQMSNQAYSPEESKLKNKIKIVREEDKATWV